ncbi:homoserine O-succinyltransferase [Halobacillus sp. A1]|nr:homoserine O-succinyltransferase [Halobacillus sp. A1]
MEHFQFEKIHYWEGIIMDWAEENVTSVLHIC